ncbi:MAG: FecR domain-containing protein [Saprospiraceae bacterium]|nr:FecR domain-containing protein [Saprospiraceae bacterium]
MGWIYGLAAAIIVVGLCYEDGFGTEHRKLKLSGKGKFTVTHNEDLPFIIESNGVFIEDLGTVFSVESMPDSDTVYVVVNEGIVRLYDEQGSEIIIKAGEKAWYIRSQKTIITDLETKVLKFDFKDTRLAEVIDLLEKTYRLMFNYLESIENVQSPHSF